MSFRSAIDAAIEMLCYLFDYKCWLIAIFAFGGMFAGVFGFMLLGIYLFQIHWIFLILGFIAGICWFPFWMELTDDFVERLEK